MSCYHQPVLRPYSPSLSLRRGRIELGDVTPHNIKQLKLLNQVVFPVSYNDKFYKDVLEAGELAKLGEAWGLCWLAGWLAGGRWEDRRG